MGQCQAWQRRVDRWALCCWSEAGPGGAIAGSLHLVAEEKSALHRRLLKCWGCASVTRNCVYRLHRYSIKR